MKKFYKFYYYNIKKTIGKKGKNYFPKDIEKYLKFILSFIEVEPPQKVLNDLFMKI